MSGRFEQNDTGSGWPAALEYILIGMAAEGAGSELTPKIEGRWWISASLDSYGISCTAEFAP